MSMAFSSIPQMDYDVFLSFRGTDTRHNIVSHLHMALIEKRIRTYIDDKDIEVGGNIISDQLVKAIKASWFAVVVLSENYATSRWCLDELQQIMTLYSEEQIKVIPIFYKVEPSDVRHQNGSLEAAFQRYNDQEKILRWKEALTQIGNMPGKHSKTCMNEATMIADIVEIISSRLQTMKPTDMLNLDNLVGMEEHMVKMTPLLNMGSENEVRVIGIWGMGGIGKTTIAKCLYDRFSGQFPARYFIEDIQKNYKDKSLSYLQERFLFSMLGGQHIGFQSVEAEIKARLQLQKVFFVLDGVDNAEQVHALAKEKSWFCPGSRIIITTRDRGLLISCRVDTVHEVKCLNDEDALQVFEKLAYGGGSPPTDGIKQLFIRASRLAHGLPSALVAYASYLSENTTIKEWEDELGLLETRPHKNVKDILKNSYENLDELDKTTFLCIACLFNGYPFSHVISLLDNGRLRINHLKAKSLVSISTDGCINMHVLVVQTGREIVRQESRYRPSRQRCLWDPKEIYDVLANDRGTDEIEGVTLHMCEMPDKLRMSDTVFKVMHSIKFLKFFQHLVKAESNVKLRHDRFYFPLYLKLLLRDAYPLKTFYFPPNLKLLHWDAYPLKTLPSFGHHHLVELDLRYSNLESLWDRTVKLSNLRRLDVTGSKNLIQLPNLSTSTNFEELIVDGCIRLRNIPESLRRLDKLTKLNAIHCGIRHVQFTVDLSMEWGKGKDSDSWKVLLIFPNERVQLNFLTDLSIEGQIYLDLDGLRGDTEHISFRFKQHIHDELVMMEQRIQTPSLWSDFRGSQSLNIKQFRYRERNAPFNSIDFFGLPRLTELKLVNLNIQEIPDSIDCLHILEKLDLSGNDIMQLPTTMGQLPELKYLSLHNCRKITSLPQLTQVETLILSDCVNLQSLLEEEAQASYCLLELWLDNCRSVQTLSYQQLLRFTKLTYLDLSRNDFVTLPPTIRRILSLETLFLNNCKKLISVEELPQNLKHLYAHGCDSLENVSLSPNHSIKHLDLIHCPNLNQGEHEHLMNRDENSQKGSQRCVCLTESGAPSRMDDEVPGTWTRISLPLIWVTLVGNFFRFLISLFRKR